MSISNEASPSNAGHIGFVLIWTFFVRAFFVRTIPARLSASLLTIPASDWVHLTVKISVTRLGKILPFGRFFAWVYLLLGKVLGKFLFPLGNLFWSHWTQTQTLNQTLNQNQSQKMNVSFQGRCRRERPFSFDYKASSIGQGSGSRWDHFWASHRRPRGR